MVEIQSRSVSMVRSLPDDGGSVREKRDIETSDDFFMNVVGEDDDDDSTIGGSVVGEEGKKTYYFINSIIEIRYST